ncbi:hypothetical protein F2Q68_00001369 [Brassica cretica]|uniref:Uncharacterized protein n=1 Tax=Brassica cretica TaxID=69181 RepID=A0A8S9JMV7_BRACR|nr:hypothetical protein F2Q68_00001369 [Brassica cretica]
MGEGGDGGVLKAIPLAFGVGVGSLHPDSDKDSKTMDPSDKDPDPDILKLAGYPIRPRPSYIHC